MTLKYIIKRRLLKVNGIDLKKSHGAGVRDSLQALEMITMHHREEPVNCFVHPRLTHLGWSIWFGNWPCVFTIVRWKFILESLTVKLRCKVMIIDMRIESEEFNRYLAKFSGIWPKKTTDLEILFDSEEEISVKKSSVSNHCDEKTERVCFVLLRRKIFWKTYRS